LLAVDDPVVEGIAAVDPAVPLGGEPVMAPEPVAPGDVAVPEGVDPVVLPVDGAGAGAGLGAGATAGVFDVVTGGVVSRLSQADKPSASTILQIPNVNERMMGLL